MAVMLRTLLVAVSLWSPAVASRKRQSTNEVILETQLGGSDAEKVFMLWPRSLPKPAVASTWSGPREIEWSAEDGCPFIDKNAKVDIFVLSTHAAPHSEHLNMYHGVLGFAVEGGPKLIFEFAPFDIMAGSIFPAQMATEEMANGISKELLRWPSHTYVSYEIDPTGDSFPGTWENQELVGTTTGAGVTTFYTWALGYALGHPRYIGWRILHPVTGKTLLASQNCYDFLFDGLRYLQGTGAGVITATTLRRTVLDVFATIELVEFNSDVAKAYTSKPKRVAEMIAVLGAVDPSSLDRRQRFSLHLMRWLEGTEEPVVYWPAWYSVTPYADGTGSIIQNTDTPRLYHKYSLATPSSEDTKTAPGIYYSPDALFPGLPISYNWAF